LGSGPHVAPKVENGPEADIVFVMDASGSVGREGFEEMKNFCMALVDTFNTDSNTHVGIILFDHKPKDIIALSSNKQKIKEELQKEDFSNWGASTVFSLALQTAHVMLSSGRGYAKKILIFQTDGYANKGDVWQPAAKLLQTEKVDIYVVGVTKSVNWQELNEIASKPKEKYTMKAASYSRKDLEKVGKSLAKEIKAA